MGEVRLAEIIQTANRLGEGIQWNAEDGCAWWTDISARQLHRWHCSSGRTDMFNMPERVGSFAFMSASSQLIVAFASGIARHDLASGATSWIARPELDCSGRRFNDGRADRHGRFWAGTMVEDEQLAAADSAALYCVDHSGAVRRSLDGVQISNGLCFSPDSRYCYFADSPRRVIFRFDFDADTARLGARRVFAQVPSPGFPDGATVDSEGCLWSAHWGTGQVVRYTPDGRIERAVAVPTRQPSCVAFGGAGLDLLFVTSAREGLSAEQAAQERMAGHMFIYHTPYSGLPEPRFGGGTAENSCASQRGTT